VTRKVEGVILFLAKRLPPLEHTSPITTFVDISSFCALVCSIISLYSIQLKTFQKVSLLVS